MEKEPLIPQNEATVEEQPTLEELRDRVTAAHQNLLASHREYSAAWSRTRRGKITTCVSLSICFLVLSSLLLGFTTLVYVGLSDDDNEEYLPRRVPLEAHIMSKCPDARDCLHDMILPAMQNVSHLVDFKLSYIGTPTDEDDGVLCKHGPSECLGDMLELCASRLYPNPKIYLGFTMCLSKSYDQIPSEDLVKDCALEHGIEFGALNECVSRDDGEVAVDLLRRSVLRSRDAGVTKSCTVRLDGKVRCVRDGGEWYDCEGGSEAKDLVEDVLEARQRHSREWLASQ